ncbi:hypothetical protein [Nonomuraea rhodomycinica]|uniref:Copper-binding protein n=1 Tax=Nonomuraea rhodomycinica TaxID=1712872 RepID=A0A7Y6IQJ0_9ACTN|nr:hypothetical protein [Nonomuraea rhodomycinica]NUW42083.1 hypothetical protein [Nonomuraea rhodomycinica]
MDANRRRTLATGAAAATAATATLLGLSGCGHVVAPSGATTSQPQPQSPPRTGARARAQVAATPAVRPTMVSVTMDEYSFSLPWHDLTAGTYTFLLSNAGSAPHAMTVDGPGIPGVAQSATILPGQRTSLTVTLRPGRYEVWCPVDDHRDLGMDTAVIVR